MFRSGSFRKRRGSERYRIQLPKFGLQAAADLGANGRELIKDIETERAKRYVGFVAQVYGNAVRVKHAHSGQNIRCGNFGVPRQLGFLVMFAITDCRLWLEGRVITENISQDCLSSSGAARTLQ